MPTRRDNGASRLGYRLRWWAMKVLPPWLGVATLTDQLLLQEAIDHSRLATGMVLVGLYPVAKRFERSSKR